jgi:hypothetical protein
MMNRQQVLVALTTNPQSPNPLSGRMVNPPAYIGVPWVGSVWGVDGAHGYGYSVVSKPSWMSTSVVTGRNTILSCTGTPTASGALVVDITDAASTTVRKSFYINARSALKGGYGEPIRIPPAFGGSPYSLDLKTYLNNPTLPLTSATVTTGSLPLGMSLSSDAVISASAAPSPTTATVNVTIVDGASRTIVLPLTLVIQAGLTVSTTSLPAAVIGNNYYAKLGISGGSGEYSVVALTPLSTVAPGLSLNSSTAEITGVATQLSPTSGALTTQFVVTDKVTGQQVTTSAIPLSVNSSVPPASPGSFVVVGSDGSGQSVDYLGTYFGDGSDGDVTISSGTTTLTRDMYYNNLTISGTGNIFVSAQGWDIYVAGVLDLSNAPQYAISANAGVNPGPYATAGGTGGTGATGAGGSGVDATDVAVGGGGSGGIGGGGGAAGDGGSGTSGAGGSSGVSGAVTNPVRKRPFTSGDLFSQPSGVVPVGAGAGGGGGGGGGGNGLGAGGNGGAGGSGGGRLRIFARTINRGASTAAGAISARASAGTNGTAGASSNRGGGGGGLGGGGGMVRIVYVTLTGATATNAIDAGGGNGGNGGNSGGGSGVAGKGGSGGAGGSIIINDLATPETTVVNGSAGSINSGQTGGAGGTCQSDL